MPGLPRNNRFPTKSMLDYGVLVAIAHQIFCLRRAISLRVVRRRYFQLTKTTIPYKDFGYANLVSYLRTVRGISVIRNSTNGQFRVKADEDDETFSLDEMHFLAMQDAYRND